MIDELRFADPEVARWWDDHTVRDYAPATKHVRHPEVGDLHFDIEIVAVPDDPDQLLVIYTAEPASETALLVPVLAGVRADTRVPARA